MYIHFFTDIMCMRYSTCSVNSDHKADAQTNLPVSILYKSIAGRYRPVRVADGPIMARYRFIKNASWAESSFVA